MSKEFITNQDKLLAEVARGLRKGGDGGVGGVGSFLIKIIRMKQKQKRNAPFGASDQGCYPR